MIENVIYKENLKMIISKPDICKDKYMVLFIHGGAWTSGNAECFLKNMQYFERLGIISASVDYRTENSVIEDCVEDCAAAVLWLKENAQRIGFDRDKIIAFGESAGGHIAAVLGTPSMLKNKNAQVCLTVNCNAVCDLTGNWMGAVKKERTFIDTYKRAYAISPIWHVSPDNSPQIIVHGLKDTDVLPQDNLNYYYELKKFGVKSDIILLPEEKHAFILFDYYAPHDTVVKIMDKIADKINEYLKEEND